jgi:hypothetical protein
VRHSILYFVLQGHFPSENLGVSFLRVAMSQVPCLHEHLANAATTSSYAAGVVMVKNKELEELSMNSTALGAENTKKESIIFISEAHEKFYYEKLKEVRYQDVYHKALCYCLGINDDTRRNANRIYDFKTGCVKTECLHEGWQTSGSVKVVRMAFNLYCNAAPSVDDYTDAEEQINECRQYTVEELFCCAYAPYFWQAIQIRYPEYATYNRKLYALFGGAD